MIQNLRSLIGKLNDPTRNALEAAAGLCLSRTHYDIEIEHVLLKLLDASDGDLAYIARHYEIDKSRLAAELTRSIDKFKSGNARTPALSPTVLKMLTEAWTLGSIDYGIGKVRSGLALLALLTNDELSRMARDFSKELQKIPPDGLRKDFLQITASSQESIAAAAAAGEAAADTPRAAGSGKTPNLDQYTVDLTGKCQTRQDRSGAGPRSSKFARSSTSSRVGARTIPSLRAKRASARQPWWRVSRFVIAQGDVPPVLKNVHVRTLDLALLQAGAGVKGEFENRLKGLIEEVKSSPTPIILFIDEAHTMIGAGGQAGQNDAANLLKPALARGELRTIAATTWSEYKKYFEKDRRPGAALPGGEGGGADRGASAW